MPGQSEYHRCYTAPIAHLSPEPNVIAGVSSAHLAVTQEPALSRKRKPLGHDRKVTFTTDFTESGSPTTEDDKVLHFRAGLRRTHLPSPTEYNMQYTWKTSVGESPLLAAANMLQEEGKGRTDGAEPNDDPGGPSHKMASKPRRQPAVEGDGKNVDQNPPIETRSWSKTSPLKKLQSHHKSSKKKAGHKRHKKTDPYSSSLVSEYRAQFKPWAMRAARVKPAAAGAKEGARSDASTPPAGQPAVLSDPSDPRLLKHSPLPAPKTRPHPLSFQLGSEYSDNFHSPTEFKFVGGAWQGAPRPDLFYKPEGSDCGQGEGEGEIGEDPQKQHSWFDQLIELRDKAAQYRHRAESSQLSSLKLLQLQQDQRGLLERASTPSTLSSSTSYSGSSRSGSRSPSIEQEGDVRLEDIEEETRGLSSPEEERRIVMMSQPGVNENANNNLPEGADVEHLHSPLEQTPTEIPVYEGRLPTPVLREKPSTGNLHYRHHLNLTTPSEGGLLVSPVKLPYPPSSPKYRRDMKSCAPIFPSPKLLEQEDQPKQHSSTREQQSRPKQDPKIHSAELSSLRPATSGATKSASRGVQTLLTYSPPRGHSHSAGSKLRSGAFRKLTFDSKDPPRPPHQQHQHRQALHGRKQDAASVQPCETCGAMFKSSTGSGKPPARSLASATLKGKDHSSTPARSDLLAATVASSQPTHTGMPQAAASSLRSKQPQRSVRHTTGVHGQSPKLANFKRPMAVGRPDRDFDELSLSTLSLSSCSVASEVLRRAQNRRDNFWTQPHMTAT